MDHLAIILGPNAGHKDTKIPNNYKKNVYRAQIIFKLHKAQKHK